MCNVKINLQVEKSSFKNYLAQQKANTKITKIPKKTKKMARTHSMIDKNKMEHKQASNCQHNKQKHQNFKKIAFMGEI